ncbi:MAG TPA: hypothetical protein VGP55_09335 [Chitinophagaceae bacterium]|nr:hypothetical protein [Chitinophagaceae bacterium]
MEPEIIETVLKEILEEIKIIHQENAEKENYTTDLKNKIQSLENALYMQETKLSQINLLRLQLQLESKAKMIEKTIREQPKNITRKIQILLFPETGAREYYRLVFGRLFFWMMMILLATYMFSLGKQFIDNWKDVTERKNELIKLHNALPDQTKSGNRKNYKK